MKVSVSITTYNHARFISEAIESVLRQETDFDYEILVGEDDSTDGTRAIVQDLHRRYPVRIRLFLNRRENVVWVEGRPTGRWNLANNLRQAKDEYIAMLDGDDAWLGTDKLQRQADFLDRHTECSARFHAVRRIYDDAERPKATMRPPGTREFYGGKDLLEQNFMHMSSVMFRRGLFGVRIPVKLNAGPADDSAHTRKAGNPLATPLGTAEEMDETTISGHTGLGGGFGRFCYQEAQGVVTITSRPGPSSSSTAWLGLPRFHGHSVKVH